MNLHILSSSSKGNGYILQNDSEALIIEAGVRLSEVKKALGWNLGKVAGCLLSHVHGDHSKYVREYLNAGIDLFTSRGTIEALGETNHRLHAVTAQSMNFLGMFRVKPFLVEHDCIEPFGFLLQHPECGKVLFATDTGYLEYLFDGLSNIIIEANYSDNILDANIRSGRTPAIVRKRVLGYHMELGVLLDFFNANDLREVNNIVLIHLSDGNSDAEQFRQAVALSPGKQVKQRLSLSRG